MSFDLTLSNSSCVVNGTRPRGDARLSLSKRLDQLRPFICGWKFLEAMDGSCLRPWEHFIGVGFGEWTK